MTFNKATHDALRALVEEWNKAAADTEVEEVDSFDTCESDTMSSVYSECASRLAFVIAPLDPELDTESSASRQHFIDTGRYLTRADVDPIVTAYQAEETSAERAMSDIAALLADAESGTERMSAVENRFSYRAVFAPEAWIDDQAVPVDAEGPKEWDATAHAEAHAEYVETLRTRQHDAAVLLDKDDVFKADPAAPAWVRAWSGPFTIWLKVPEGEEICTYCGSPADAPDPTCPTCPETERVPCMIGDCSHIAEDEAELDEHQAAEHPDEEDSDE